MFAKTVVGVVSGMVIAAAPTIPAAAQVSGHVVLGGGPIGLSVVFGPQATRVVEPRVHVRYEAPAPVRYRAGMSLRELEYYLERIDFEYELYRRMRPDEARYRFGWSRDQLRDYVRWLRDERNFLRDEQKRLLRSQRFDPRDFGHPRGRGRGLARGNPHR
jgi:hypothetical protein